MTKLIVDGREIDVDPAMTLLQACEEAGAEIPRFCYHERLSIAGNCRMCLIEVEGVPKPQASCAMSVRDVRPPKGKDLPVLHTLSPMVKKAREGVMEFLLANHPLDCPICDQGGECDLQDQSMAYGTPRSRFPEMKRAVEEKYMGPLVKTVMTRCIHCTRCIRFMTEVAGVPNLGATGRGEDMEITTYLEQAIDSELSGNIVDLCPVGALTAKPYAFMARSWELRKTESIDVMDAVGSNIRIDARGREVLRILPRLHEDVNEEWISDKTRHVWDGLARQRLDQPYVRRNGRLEPVSWPAAFGAIKARLHGLEGSQVAALAGDLPGTEGLFAALMLIEALGSPHRDCRQDGAKLGLLADGARAPRASYLFNSGIAGIERADALLLIGTNPRLEAALLNARIRKRWLQGAFPIGLVGEAADFTYPYEHLGTGKAALEALARGEHPFTDVLRRAARPMLVLGHGALARPDGAAIVRSAADIAARAGAIKPAAGGEPAWNGWNVLHTAAARVGALGIGFLPAQGGLDTAGILAASERGDIQALFLLGTDEIVIPQSPHTLKIYVGSHGERGAQAADVVLPAAAYTEEEATFVNTEGRAQLARRAVFPPGEAKETWAIFRALSEVLGKTLPFDSLEGCRAKLYERAPHLARLDAPPEFAPLDLTKLGAAGAISDAPLRSPVRDYYLTNPIARASSIMAECSAMFSRPRAMAAE
jgi:NADH-quinone oxidoreductase subunit G